jgi:hypothetical protein
MSKKKEQIQTPEIVENVVVKNDEIEEAQVVEVADATVKEPVGEEVDTVAEEVQEFVKEEAHSVSKVADDVAEPVNEDEAPVEVKEDEPAQEEPVKEEPKKVVHNFSRNLGREFNFTWNGMSY